MCRDNDKKKSSETFQLGGRYTISSMLNLYNYCPRLSSPVDNFFIFYIIQGFVSNSKLPSHDGDNKFFQPHAPNAQKTEHPSPPDG